MQGCLNPKPLVKKLNSTLVIEYSPLSRGLSSTRVPYDLSCCCNAKTNLVYNANPQDPS